MGFVDTGNIHALEAEIQSFDRWSNIHILIVENQTDNVKRVSAAIGAAGNRQFTRLIDENAQFAFLCHEENS